jgi:nucleoside triphosphate pyrophosphatase
LSLWLAPAPLVIASKSAVRRAVLEAAGIPLEVRPADIDERGIESRSSAASPGEVAALLAREKARAIAAVMPGRLVLGADQTLALGSRRFSKPVDRAAAREQLQALRGRTHELHSAVAVVRDAEVLYDRVEVARLTMRPFADDFLDRYIETAGSAVTASVGGYQLERTGIHLFSRVEGDHFTVLGLPLLPLLEFLRNQGLVA